LCFAAQTLVFYGSNTCVLRLKHLCLSRQGFAPVGQGAGGRCGKLFLLLAKRCESAFKVLVSDMAQTLFFLHDGAVPGKIFSSFMRMLLDL
ncbi:hypothetical protein ACMYZ5_07875, partial [Bacteroides sp. KG68]|uniref:hypothetical protein n=1 Tax=Bacteroides sp. KG68 TaxID=3397824 RepID=UPI003D956839